MGVYIKGIDMPKKGEHIVALIKSDGECSYWKQEIEHGTCEPMQTVKAIQIPTPHGRLIDADALFQDLREHNIPFNNDINSAINVAPTILEAEV